MATDSTGVFGIPAEMQKFTEQSFDQAKKAFDGFVAAANHAATTLEKSASTARAGATDAREKALAFAEKNVAASFEFAQKLVRATDPQEVVRLQTEYVQRQIQALGEQAKEFGQGAVQTAVNAAKPVP